MSSASDREAAKETDVDVNTVSRAGLKRARHDWAHQAMDHWPERVTTPTAGLTLETRNIILNIMKTSRKVGATDTISTHQMRFEFERVLQAVKAGRSLTLTYRSKPLARIVPLKEKQALPEDDPIFRLDELAEPIGPLTNAQIDALVYDQ